MTDAKTKAAAEAAAQAEAEAKAEAEAQAKAAAEAAKLPAGQMEVVTKGVGSNAKGLVPVGTKMTIKISAFSSAWMKPASRESAKRLTAWQKEKAQSKQAS